MNQSQKVILATYQRKVKNYFLLGRFGEAEKLSRKFAGICKAWEVKKADTKSR